MSLLRAELVKNSHIQVWIHFFFLTNILKETWNTFTTKFWRQEKNQQDSYHVRQIFAIFAS